MLMGWMDPTILVIIWPEQTDRGSLWLIECETATSYDLRATRSIANLGLEHFFKARHAAARSSDLKEARERIDQQEGARVQTWHAKQGDTPSRCAG